MQHGDTKYSKHCFVRARRLKEKQGKERKRRERMGWDTEYQCYTNQDNPFGDSALTNTFVWSKKLAKEGVKSVSHDELEALNRQKQMENKIELEKVTTLFFMSKCTSTHIITYLDKVNAIHFFGGEAHKCMVHKCGIAWRR